MHERDLTCHIAHTPHDKGWEEWHDNTGDKGQDDTFLLIRLADIGFALHAGSNTIAYYGDNHKSHSDSKEDGITFIIGDVIVDHSQHQSDTDT